MNHLRAFPASRHYPGRMLTSYQQINSASSPYEAEDDFFSRQHSQDDSSIATRSPSGGFETSSRPRGQSESVVSNGAQS